MASTINIQNDPIAIDIASYGTDCPEGHRWRIDIPAGLGDIFLALKTVLKMAETREVIWPIYPQMWEHGIGRLATMPITWCHPGEPETTRDVIPGMGKMSMMERFTTFGVSPTDWAQAISWNRNTDLEQGLREHLGLRLGEPFIITNSQYSFIHRYLGPATMVPQDYDGKVVEVNPIRGITIFEWAWLLENAEEIHSVDTALVWFAERLNLKARRLTVHPRGERYAPQYLRNFLPLWQHPWELQQPDEETYMRLNQLNWQSPRNTR